MLHRVTKTAEGHAFRLAARAQASADISLDHMQQSCQVAGVSPHLQVTTLQPSLTILQLSQWPSPRNAVGRLCVYSIM